MSQPVRKGVATPAKSIKNTPKKREKKPNHRRGISKLEDRFAKDFLDAAGYKYIRQYEAKDIKRFYDFMVVSDNGMGVLLEIDGSYYHGYGLTRDEKSPMQKKNERVDKIKDQWAHLHSIPIIRIWEHDINNNPEKVRKILQEQIGDAYKKKEIENKKKSRGRPSRA